MSKKSVVVSLGHDALGYTTTEQWDAVKVTAKALADLVEADYQLTITHSNGPQVSMIHKAMTELRRVYIDYTPAPMCVCSAMSQGYVGYDIQNSLRAELLDRGISKPVSTILTQVTVDPYDEAFYEPTKVIGRYMSKEDAEIEVKKGNYVKEDPGKGFRRVVAAPKPIDIVEIEAIRALAAVKDPELQKLLAKQYFDIARMSTRPLENEELSAFIRQSYQLAARLAEKED